jgi:formylglycine-generating enzyme required for sulfatase activity
VEVTCNLTTFLIADLTLWYSTDLGQSYHRCDSVSGDLNVQSSGSKTIIWDCFAENVRFGGVKFKVTAIDVIEMVAVQGSTFNMGCNAEQEEYCFTIELPLHEVTLSDFYISKYEVTQAQWEKVMGNNPSYFIGDSLPVAVTWYNTQEFFQELSAITGKNCRLSTEAEWEYAARGGVESSGYRYSGSNNVGDVAWYRPNADSVTHPVGRKLPNELGLYDMSGNSWEWCSDWYDRYSGDSQTNPTGPDTSPLGLRVMRGGGMVDESYGCRVSVRHYSAPGDLYSNVGFRVVVSP